MRPVLGSLFQFCGPICHQRDRSGLRTIRLERCALSRVRLSTITVRIWLLGKKSQQAGRHQRSTPDQVEVEPSVTEKREAELTIECPGDQSRDGKITDRVDSCSENPF